VKKFRFTLEKVHEYKVHMESAEKAELKRLNDRRREFAEELGALLDRETLQREDCERRCREGIPAGELQMLFLSLAELGDMIDKQRKRIALLDREISGQIEKIVHISRDNSSMEKLRQKQISHYEHEENKENEKFIEDFVQNRTLSSDSL